MTLVIDEEAVREVLTPELAVDQLEQAFTAEGKATAVHGTIVHTLAPQHRQDDERTFYSLRSMPAADSDVGVATLRVGSDELAFPTVRGTRRRQVVPANSDEHYMGFILLFSMETRELLAIIVDGHFQTLRVGGTAAVAAKQLARPNARTLGLIGSSWQAQAQLRCLAAVRPLEQAWVYSPTPEHRERFARQMNNQLNIPIHAVESAQQAVRDADIVSTATSTHEPVFKAEWLRPGVHLTTVRDRELEPAVHRKADIVATTRRGPRALNCIASAQGDPLPRAETDNPAGDFLDWEAMPTLGEIRIGKGQGRESSDQVTCFYNRGTGVQFPRLAARVYEQAKEQGQYDTFPTEWLKQTVPD